MRFINKQIFYSMQFYSCAVSGNSSFEKFIEYWIECLNHGESEIKDIEAVQLIYSEHIQNNFNKNLLFCKEIKKIIFDDKGGIKPLDSDIYYKLKIFYDKYSLHEKLSFQKVLDSSTIIRYGNFSKGILDLANLNKHDNEISSLGYDNQRLKIIFSYNNDYIKSYSFHTVDNWEYKYLDQFIDNKVLYEELFLNDDGTFEYNILQINAQAQYFDDYIQDLSIQFYDAELESDSL